MKSGTTKSAAPPATRWRRIGVAVGAAVVLLAAAVLAARWLVTLPAVQGFLEQYPGRTPLPEAAPVGFPAWLGWQHFLNAFLILLIAKTGWAVRTTARPAAHWTRNNRGRFRTKNPPKRISMDLWLHLTLDALWVLNGLVFIVLLFATGQWMRIVPTSWEVFPNAASAALQYLSLDWPLEDGWVNYNSLQLLTYFATVFVAAPLAIATGLRMSEAWPKRAAVNRAFPLEAARAVHYPVMLYFVLFTIVHVALVLATGALRNLNHMYAARDDASWVGFWIFAASLAAMVAAWFLSKPVFMAPVASLTGKVSR